MKIKDIKDLLLVIFLLILIVAIFFGMISYRKQYLYKQQILELNDDITELELLIIQKGKERKKIIKIRTDAENKLKSMPKDKYLKYLKEKYDV